MSSFTDAATEAGPYTPTGDGIVTGTIGGYRTVVRHGIKDADILDGWVTLGPASPGQALLRYLAEGGDPAVSALRYDQGNVTAAFTVVSPHPTARQIWRLVNDAVDLGHRSERELIRLGVIIDGAPRPPLPTQPDGGEVAAFGGFEQFAEQTIANGAKLAAERPGAVVLTADDQLMLLEPVTTPTGTWSIIIEALVATEAAGNTLHRAVLDFPTIPLQAERARWDDRDTHDIWARVTFDGPATSGWDTDSLLEAVDALTDLTIAARDHLIGRGATFDYTPGPVHITGQPTDPAVQAAQGDLVLTHTQIGSVGDALTALNGNWHTMSPAALGLVATAATYEAQEAHWTNRPVAAWRDVATRAIDIAADNAPYLDTSRLVERLWKLADLTAPSPPGMETPDEQQP